MLLRNARRPLLPAAGSQAVLHSSIGVRILGRPALLGSLPCRQKVLVRFRDDSKGAEPAQPPVAPAVVETPLQPEQLPDALVVVPTAPAPTAAGASTGASGLQGNDQQAGQQPQQLQQPAQQAGGVAGQVLPTGTEHIQLQSTTDTGSRQQQYPPPAFYEQSQQYLQPSQQQTAPSQGLQQTCRGGQLPEQPQTQGQVLQQPNQPGQQQPASQPQQAWYQQLLQQQGRQGQQPQGQQYSAMQQPQAQQGQQQPQQGQQLQQYQQGQQPQQQRQQGQQPHLGQQEQQGQQPGLQQSSAQQGQPPQGQGQQTQQLQQEQQQLAERLQREHAEAEQAKQAAAEMRTQLEATQQQASQAEQDARKLAQAHEQVKRDAEAMAQQQQQEREAAARQQQELQRQQQAQMQQQATAMEHQQQQLLQEQHKQQQAAAAAVQQQQQAAAAALQHQQHIAEEQQLAMQASAAAAAAPPVTGMPAAVPSTASMPVAQPVPPTATTAPVVPSTSMASGTAATVPAATSTSDVPPAVLASGVTTDASGEVVHPAYLGVGRTTSTLFGCLSSLVLVGGIVAMTVPQAVCQHLFQREGLWPLEVKLLLVAAGATLIPVSQAFRTLMVRVHDVASDHQLVGSRTAMQLCYVTLAWGASCSLVTAQAVSLHNPVLLGAVGAIAVTSVLLSAFVMQRIHKAASATEDAAKGVQSGIISRTFRLVWRVIVSCLSMFAPRTVPSLVYAVLSLFYMGAGLVMAMPRETQALLSHTPEAARLLLPEHLMVSGAPHAATIFNSRLTTAGLYAASTLAFVLKEVADRRLLHQVPPRGINSALGLMSLVHATVLAAVLTLGIVPVNDITVAALATTSVAALFCLGHWLHNPYWDYQTAGGVRPGGIRGFFHALFGRRYFHPQQLSMHPAYMPAAPAVVHPAAATAVQPGAGATTMLQPPTTTMATPMYSPAYPATAGAYPDMGLHTYSTGAYPATTMAAAAPQAVAPVAHVTAPMIPPVAHVAPPTTAVHPATAYPAVTPLGAAGVTGMVGGPAVAMPADSEHTRNVQEYMDDAAFHTRMNMPGP